MNPSLLETTPHSHTQLILGFVTLVIALITLDMFVLRKKDKAPGVREAFLWSGFYVVIALGFAAWIWSALGAESAMTYLTGYVIEMSLSVDNLFVFILIFSGMKIHGKYQHRILFWGILGALIMRAICIAAGVAVLERFEWMTYVFAAILIWAGIKTFRGDEDDDQDDPANGPIARTIQRIFPVKSDYKGHEFFTRDQGRTFATPLFVALILIEISDIIFAVDSVPAVLAVSKDPFIVYSSNIFAILGLRNLYFVLASLVEMFKHLDKAIAFVLIFIGIKIGLEHWYSIPVGIALSVILGALAAGIGFSLALREKSR